MKTNPEGGGQVILVKKTLAAITLTSLAIAAAPTSHADPGDASFVQ